MVVDALRRARVPSWGMHLASMGGIGVCLGLWVRAKTLDDSERGNAERRAMFVGLWPPTMWLLGDALERAELRQQEGRGR